MVLRLRIRPGILFDSLPVANAIGDTPPSFALLSQRPQQRSLPLACSLAIHAAIISGGVWYSDYVRIPVEQIAAKYTVRYLRLRAAAPFRLSSPVLRGNSLQSPDGASSRPPLRRFELPRSTSRGSSGQLLIQPELRAELLVKRDLRVPQLLLWKPQPPAPAQLPRKVFVARSRPVSEVVPINLPAPPAVAHPNREMNLASMPFTGPLTKPDPVLPVATGSTAPIRITGSGETSPIPEILPAGSGDSGTLNIVSLPNGPVPPSGVFELPGASQSQGTEPLHSTGQIGGNGQTGGNLNAGAGNEGGSPGHGQGLAGTHDAPAASVTIAGHPVSRIVRPPDGHFQVTVESSGSEAFADTEGVLSGRLIYTVYIRAGARKDWILQYCVPKEAEQRMPVKGKTPALEPPYPFLMLRPDLTFAPDIDYYVVHGIVDVLGKFDGLSYISAPEEQSQKQLLLRALEQWQLRPGKVDGQPAALEILLIIPREGE